MYCTCGTLVTDIRSRRFSKAKCKIFGFRYPIRYLICHECGAIYALMKDGEFRRTYDLTDITSA